MVFVNLTINYDAQDNLNLDPLPYLWQLLKNEAATFALAKTILSKET